MIERLYEKMLVNIFRPQKSYKSHLTPSVAIELRCLLAELPEDQRMILSNHYHLEKIPDAMIKELRNDDLYSQRLNQAKLSFAKKITDSGLDIEFFYLGDDGKTDLYIDLYRQLRNAREEIEEYRQLLHDSEASRTSEALEAKQEQHTCNIRIPKK